MKKCNQCGTCCKNEVCLIGIIMFKIDKPPCPALIYRDGKYWCGVVEKADLVSKGLSDYFAELLGIGVCCDAIKSVIMEEEGED